MSRSNPLVKRLHQRYRGRCAYCGCWLRIDDVTIDHIRPASKNGRNSSGNYHPACKKCNQDKADFRLERWRRRIQKHGTHFELIDGHYFYFEKHRAYK